MEKNETLYKKVEEGLYDIFRHGTSAIMILGGIGMVAGFITGEKI